ncbi:hypothetical protein CHU98_g7236 [Xylaria longipes]|nr:hypothetical protein CHU98_g7236 [Xylaria longipes]
MTGSLTTMPFAGDLQTPLEAHIQEGDKYRYYCNTLIQPHSSPAHSEAGCVEGSELNAVLGTHIASDHPTHRVVEFVQSLFTTAEEPCTKPEMLEGIRDCVDLQKRLMHPGQ